ncbi:ABC transporter substrate-binding protein [Microbacterium sp. C7(2022)]|uniref:ABC transporter substrate-binding protein n=1 Tax=Microbacterium sp. C7(2022) TaxID=2992759 RepID=UPI00237A2D01|nr:ABC transporter substrate-binding protein [Microbacterium sp. C7(2022)]MDE0547424.1 ABC transporter substrate-binding protein [Microbacterium sp. C7(2022)]
MSTTFIRRASGITALALAAVTVAGCASSTPTATPEAASDLEIGAVDLSGVCPATVVIQTDWNPQAEQGGLFNLVGEDAQIDAATKRVSGPLVSSGEWTGVDVEIRAGGPAIGFTGVPAQMYTDPDILLGWVKTDEAIANSAERPTTAVMSTFEKAPWIVMWDPETYPEVDEIADLADTDATVRYFDGTTYMDYLIGSGQLRADQVDGSYDGTPANFIAAGGADAQQGFATVEPWVYENAIEGWMKPVDYQLVADTGYPIYAVALSVRTADVTEQAECLSALIPVVQQATVDYFADPEAANALLVDAVTAYDNGWVYPAEEAANSTTQQQELALAANGADGTFGSFDSARVDSVMEIVEPIMADKGVATADDLTADDLATNEFLDSSIALP